MDFPRRIFIALGEPSDVSSLASDDLRRQEDRERLQRAIREREAAIGRRNSWRLISLIFGGRLISLIVGDRMKCFSGS
jgi:hypothetical protein